MRRIVSRTLFVCTVTVFGSGKVLAAHAVELRVTGRIIPDACLTSFSNNGVVDYGSLSAEKRGASNMLDRKSISLSVICATPSRVAIRLIDNRSNASIPPMQAVAARYRNNAYLFGLGPRTGRNAGGYTISYKPLLAHGSPVLLESPTNINAIQWSVADGNMLRKDVLYSWEAMHKTYPRGTVHFQATFAIQPVLESSDTGEADNDNAQINGSATFELLYL